MAPAAPDYGMEEEAAPMMEPAMAAPPPPPPPPPPMMAEPALETDPEPVALEPAPKRDEGPALSDKQLDALFDEKTVSGAPAPLNEGAGKEEHVSSLEEVQEPEPLPQSLTQADDAGDKDAGDRSSGLWWKILVGVFVLLALVAAALFFLRGMVVDLWPGASDLYRMIGIQAESIGAGLDIRGVQSAREQEEGIEVLIVRGSVANVSKQPRDVPVVQVTLFDAKGAEIHSVAVPPLKPQLAGGETIGFRAKITDPSPLARRLEVTFTSGEKKK